MQTRSGIRAVAAALAAAAACAWNVVSAQMEGTDIILDRFASQGYAPDGTLSWELRGGRAVLKGAEADISDVLVIFHPKAGDGVIHMTSPRCQFNRTTSTGRSDAPVRVEGNGFVLEGVGYDLATKAQMVHIRSAVHMTVSGSRAGVLSEALQPGSGTAPDGSKQDSK